MDGTNPAPAAGSRLRRLLRRGLLIAVLTMAGWLLSAMFANSAAADEPLPDGPPAQEELPASGDPTDTPANEPTEQPTEQPTEAPGEAPVDEVPAPPATEPGAEPIAEPGTEPGTEPAAEPGTEPGTEPIAEPGTEPGTEPVAEPITEPVTEPIAEPGTDTESAPGTEPGAAPLPDPVQEHDQAPPQGGLIDGLATTLGGLTHAVADVAAAVSDNTGHALAPIITPHAGDPVLLLPDLGLPGDPLGFAGTSRAEALPVPAAPPVPPATPVLPATIVIAPEHTPRAAVAAVAPQSTSSQPGGASEHADESGPGQPVKAPVAPGAPGGTLVSTAFDNAGGARGPHGVLTAQTSLRPSAAGFTTRSRAADVTGRIAGLPAISPD